MAAQAERQPALDKLHVDGLYKIFGDRPAGAHRLALQGLASDEIRDRTGCMVAVRDVAFRVAPGEIFVIMGLSGSGKSTLIRCVNQLLEPTAGRVMVDGEDMIAAPEPRRREMRRRKLAMVFQNFALLPHRTVLQNVEYGLAVRGESRRQRTAKAMASLRLVGLDRWADHRPDALSGGMRQRVGLMRALATDADLLLMDEPFSALDPLIRRNLQDELLRLQRQLQRTIVFVTHDFHEAVRLGSAIGVMRDGRMVQIGSPRDLLCSPASDYVREFTRDIDRGAALSAGDALALRSPGRSAGASLGTPIEAAHDAATVAFDQPLNTLYPIVAAGARALVLDRHGHPLGWLGAGDVLQCLDGTQGSAPDIPPRVRDIAGTHA